MKGTVARRTGAKCDRTSGRPDAVLAYPGDERTVLPILVCHAGRGAGHESRYTEERFARMIVDEVEVGKIYLRECLPPQATRDSSFGNKP